MLVYPARHCKEEYVNRYLKRDGSEKGIAFANLIAANWDAWITECEQQEDVLEFQLGPNHYLSDVYAEICRRFLAPHY